MSHTISFTIQGDSEGYITFECPFCGSEFKLQAGEYQNEDIPIKELFCPYCGLTSEKDNFLSEEVRQKIYDLMENYAIEQLNKAFKSMERAVNRNGKGIIKMKSKPLKKVNVKEIREKDTAETVFCCQHCGQHNKVLYCAGASKIFCPYCGVDI